MKKLFVYFFILTLVSCGGSFGDFSTSSTGVASEILVVSQPDIWQGEFKDTVSAIFTDVMYGLPQPESRFSILAIPNEKFTKILQPYRNIFIPEIDPSLEKSKLKLAHDKWATPQTIVQLQSPNRTKLIEDFVRYKDQIMDYFHESELRRYQRLNDRSKDFAIINMIKEKYKFNFTIPKDYFVATKEDDFLWLRKEMSTMSHAILFYKVPYTDTKQFSSEEIIKTRNSFVNENIPGSIEGSYMTTSLDVYLPESKVIDFKEMYAVETRGLWKLVNDFMGGPFVNICFTNPEGDQLYFIEGFVYAPENSKRDQIRQVEAILNTFEWVE